MGKCRSGSTSSAAARKARTRSSLDDGPVASQELTSLVRATEEEVQWTMNSCLAKIGINHPGLRKRAIAIGEKLGVLRDNPVSNGWTSPFAPFWINEMVKRKGY